LQIAPLFRNHRVIEAPRRFTTTKTRAYPLSDTMQDTISGSTLAGGASAAPRPLLLAGNQYVKSVSFQINDTPAIFSNLPATPHVALNLDVTARQLADGQPNFEVCLVMHCQSLVSAPTAEAPSPTRIFEANISYAGLFALQNATNEALEPMLLIDAPHLLFPAARNYLADLTREAGLAPTLIQQVDFRALWQQRRQNQG